MKAFIDNALTSATLDEVSEVRIELEYGTRLTVHQSGRIVLRDGYAAHTLEATVSEIVEALLATAKESKA